MPRSNRDKPSSIPAADTEEQCKFFRLNLRSHMMLLFLLAFYAGPYKSVRATLEGWRTSIRAKFAAGNMYLVNSAPYPQDGGRSLCNAHVHGITNTAHYARNRAQQQQQAEEAERGQHLEKQLSGAAALLDIRAEGWRSTNADDVDSEYFLRRMDKSAGGEGNDYHIAIKALSKNEAVLTAEDELVWARERFRADCAALAIRTCQDAKRHYIRIRDACAAVVSDGPKYIDRWCC